MKNLFSFCFSLLIFPCIISALKIKAIPTPVIAQNIQAPLSPSLDLIYSQRNVRSNPLDPLTPITLGGNKAEENPLISEGNREMLKDFKTGPENFKEEPVLANNKIDTQVLKAMAPTITQPAQTLIVQNSPQVVPTSTVIVP